MAVSRSGRCLVLGSWLMMLPFGYVKIAIENGDLEWIYPLKMVIYSGITH